MILDINGKQIEKTRKLSPKESIKSLRDIALMGVGAMIPQFLQIVLMTDFGEYEMLATATTMFAMPFINRFLNLIRIK